MKTKCHLVIVLLTAFLLQATARADYQKGETMFQIYGGGAAMGGRYHQPGVSRDEEDFADGAGVLGGQFLYYISESPCLAVGFDVSHAGFDSHDSYRLLADRFTQSSADNTTGVFVARLVYPKGRVRPYIQGGIGAHHTSLSLDGTTVNSSVWEETNTTETRSLVHDGHVGPAFEGAVGAHLYLTDRFFIGAEYKVLSLIGKKFTPTPAGRLEGLSAPDGSVGISAIGLMLGFGF